MRIILNENFNYDSVIEIKKENKNYNQLKLLNNILIDNNLNWKWLFEKIKVSERQFHTYISGKESLSLLIIEKIAFELIDYVNSPKVLMNENYPKLKLGKHFKLNIVEIMKKYQIHNCELLLGVNIDKGSLSYIKSNKTTQLRADRLIEFFEYFKSRGVPLNTPLDLIYFPLWDEKPFDFIVKRQNNNITKHMVYKFNSFIKVA